MCAWGHSLPVEVTVPAGLSCTGADRRAVKPIDACIAPLVAWLDAHGYAPANSCCGHGRRPGEVILADGRVLVVNPLPGRGPGA